MSCNLPSVNRTEMFLDYLFLFVICQMLSKDYPFGLLNLIPTGNTTSFTEKTKTKNTKLWSNSSNFLSIIYSYVFYYYYYYILFS